MRYALLIAALLTPFSLADTLETRDGKQFAGTATFTNDVITMKTNEGIKRFPLAEVASFARETAPVKQGSQAFAGLMAEYFSDLEWKNACAISLIQGGDFDWGHEPPNSTTPAQFSVRMTGWLTFPRKGTYRFGSNELTRLEVDGKRIGQDSKADLKGYSFEAGQRVSVLMEFRKQKGVHGRASVRWVSEGIDEQSIPEQLFSTPDGFVARLDTFYRQSLPGSRGGLKGEYFSDNDFKQRVLVRLDPNISMNWPSSASIDPALKEGFSARWTGRIRATRTGSFKFRILRGMRLWINNTVVVDAWPKKDRNEDPQPGTYSMKEGESYDVKIEAIRGKGWGDVRVASTLEADWMPPLNAKLLSPPDDVPRTRIILPMDKSNVDATGGATVRIAATPGGSPIKKVEILTNEGREVIGESTVAPYDIIIRPREAREMIIQSRVTNNDGFTSFSEPVNISFDSPNEPVAGGPWSIGRVGNSPAPRVSFEKETIVVTGESGAVGERSNLPLITQVVKGDCEIIARLAELKADNPNVTPIGGLTLRRGMWAETPHMSLTASDKRGWYVTNVYRRSESSSYQEKAFHVPVWFRMSRAGTSTTAYWSDNGTDWNQLGSLSLGDDDPLVVGLTAFGMAEGGPVRAVFDNVSVRASDEARVADGPGVQLIGGSIVSGVVRFEGDNVLVRGGNGTAYKLEKSKVARVFYGSVTASQLADVPSGWRGALVNNDRMEGDPSSISAEGATVTSVLFGPQALTPAAGLVMVSLADVQPVANATLIRHTRGRAVAKDIRIEGGKLLCHDDAFGDLTLELSDILSIRQGR